MQRLGWKTRPSAVHELQAAAAVGQMGLVHVYESCFIAHNLRTAQVLLTHADLTDRERDVLTVMAEGRTNAAICERLGIGAKTVEMHVNTIFSKLGLEPAADDNRRVLAVLAYLRQSGGLSE